MALLQTPVQPEPSREVKRAPMRALISWVLFDFAAQPYYTLVLTFLFAPYFANAVVGDPVQGQALWGYAAAAASVLVAAGSPLLGAFADGRDRLKPWIGLLSAILALSLMVLWYAEPGASTSIVLLVLFAFVIATVAVEFTTVFTNSMMTTLVPPDTYGRLSGIGWGVGYLGGLISLGIMAGFVVSSVSSGKTLMGLDPVLDLDPVTRDADRLVGPFAALWFILFMIPFFLFVPDQRARRAVATAGRGSAFSELWRTLRNLPSHRDMLLFLIARMLYADGLAAIFTFGGIYGAAVFGWGALELGLFGIILSVTGMIGAIIGGFIDDRAGSKKVIVVSLIVLLAGALGILSVDKSHVLFVVEVAPKAAGSAPLSAAGEQVFVVFAMLVGLVAAPVQAASRALLARLAPPDRINQFFGLFAFSGRVTAFLAPLLVATVTTITGDQRLGMASIALFLIAGLIMILPVREPFGRRSSPS